MPIVVCAVLTAAGAVPSAVILAKTAKINKGNKEKENQEEKEEKTHAVNTLYMAGINLIFMMLTHSSDELQNLIVLAGAVISVGFAIDTILLFLFKERKKENVSLTVSSLLECAGTVVLLVSMYG